MPFVIVIFSIEIARSVYLFVTFYKQIISNAWFQFKVKNRPCFPFSDSYAYKFNVCLCN